MAPKNRPGALRTLRLSNISWHGWRCCRSQTRQRPTTGRFGLNWSGRERHAALDMQIGAHARSEGLIVVTNNIREFVRMPGVRVENWL